MPSGCLYGLCYFLNKYLKLSMKQGEKKKSNFFVRRC